MTDRRIPTGVFVEAMEAKKAIQLFGEYHEHKENPIEERTRKQVLNDYLKELSKKYNYEEDWLDVEIAPNGEIIHIVRDKDRDESQSQKE